MPSDAAKSFAPPYAVLMWSDGTAVYAECPFKDGTGTYIQRYPYNEGGLHKALMMLTEVHKIVGKPYEVKLVKVRPSKLSPSDEQKERVKNILKRRGLL